MLLLLLSILLLILLLVLLLLLPLHGGGPVWGRGEAYTIAVQVVPPPVRTAVLGIRIAAGVPGCTEMFLAMEKAVSSVPLWCSPMLLPSATGW